MKILFTGMASSHCKPAKNIGFFNTLAEVFSEIGEVEWAAPSVKWTKDYFDEYDLVVVGFVPPSALSANKLYGALNAINLLWDSPKLRLVLDFPQLWQYKISLSKADRDPSGGLFSKFYVNRFEYLTSLNNKSVIQAIKKLNSKKWPQTIFPQLPWQTEESVWESLKFESENPLVGINLDSYLLENVEDYGDIRHNEWSVNDRKLKWAKSVLDTTRFGAKEVKASRAFDDDNAEVAIRTSIGFMNPPQDRKVGSWWSYRLVQAMKTRTPIVTDWKETLGFSSAWSLLAYQLEDMTPAERSATAIMQAEQYLSAIPSKSGLIKIIEDKIVKDSAREENNA